MKRPKFFEDLDRSLRGEEPEPEPPAFVLSDAEIRAAAMRDCHQGMAALRARYEQLEPVRISIPLSALTTSVVASPMEFWKRK